MSKNFILTILLGTALFMGAYLVWTTWVNPRSPEGVSQATAPNAPVAAKNIPASITVVPAPLTKEGIPAKLGDFALTQTMTGPDALAEFAQLHGKGFDLTGGYMAHYGKDQALLWVGQAKDAQAAKEMVEQMATKIGAGNPMFKDLQPLDIGGRVLYSVTGQGQEHFFYAANEKIVWVAVDPRESFEALHSLWSAVK